jgi:hypothetical protein
VHCVERALASRDINRLVQTTANLRRWPYGPRPVSLVKVREAIAAAGGGKVTVADAPPAGAAEGDLYWDTVSGQLFVFYMDIDSSAWVIANTVAVSGDQMIDCGPF